MDADRIHFPCNGCHAVMIAPVDWAGRPMKCPVCALPCVVPSADIASTDVASAKGASNDVASADVASATATTATANVASATATTATTNVTSEATTSVAPGYGNANPPAVWRSRTGDLVINVVDSPIFTRGDRPGRVQKPVAEPMGFKAFVRRYRVYLVAGFVLLGLLGWWASWKWYYQHYVKAEAIMRNRGYGRQLSAPLTEDPKITALISRVDFAESRQFDNPADVGLTMDLVAAYDAALREVAHFPKNRANAVLNNAAWLFSTTPHLGLRDPERALKLAESAVVQTCRKESGYLDTLAEALSVNGRHAEALEVAREAHALKPDDQYLIDREQHFNQLAAPAPLPAP